MPSKLLRAAELLFNIYDKEGTLIPFRMNEAQVALDAMINMEGKHRLSILKARQRGVSTWVMVYFLMVCMSRYATCVMLAHDKDHTERLLQRAKLILQNMNGPKPKTSRLNDNEISFQKTQSSFFIGTAGNVNFGRSATITHLHCSEIAFWKDPKTLLTGLLQAVPKETGVVLQETTANGWGTWFQRRYYEYRAKAKAFDAVFFPWFTQMEYTASTDAEHPLTEYENWLANDLGLNLRQIQWRREKLDEFDGDETLFKQEYPATVEEAFRVTGGSLFPDVKLAESSMWVVFDKDAKILNPHPLPGLTYVIGADSSGGTGNDSATIVVSSMKTKEVVFTYTNNKIAPPAFGEYVVKIGKMFNEAYLVPESNSHGLSTIAIIKPLYNPVKIYKMVMQKGAPSQASLNIPSHGYGFRTTTLTKPYMVGVAQKFITDGFAIYDPELFDQLLSFTETEEGKLEGAGDHDDLAIAFMLSCVGILKVLKNPVLYGCTEKPVVKSKDVVIHMGETHVHLPSWRDEMGRYLVAFEEMFKKKQERLL